MTSSFVSLPWSQVVLFTPIQRHQSAVNTQSAPIKEVRTFDSMCSVWIDVWDLVNLQEELIYRADGGDNRDDDDRGDDGDDDGGVMIEMVIEMMIEMIMEIMIRMMMDAMSDDDDDDRGDDGGEVGGDREEAD